MKLAMKMFALTALAASPAAAAYVQPQMGGGQVAMGTVSMKHADVSFDGRDIAVHIDESTPTPLLRGLDPPDEFDPLGPWSVINGSDYNFQYGWNPSRFDAYPPDGTWVWVEQLDASPGLRTYQRTPASPAGEPIFGTDASSLRWRWGGSMTHNLYAIDAPTEANLWATYRVYIGDDAAGEPVAGFGATEVTFHFRATPRLPGDYDRDGLVDAADYRVWREQYGTQPEILGTEADGNGDGVVNAADYTVWRDHVSEPDAAGVLQGVSVTPAPSPSAVGLLIAGATPVAIKRRRPVC